MQLSFMCGLAFFIAACSDIDDVNNDPGVVADNFSSGVACLELIFPLTLILPDETEVEVSDKANIKETVKSYREENPGGKVKPEFVFPIEVLNGEGETLVVNNVEDFQTLKEACRGERSEKRSKCLELVYPVSYTFQDGSTRTFASRAETKAAFKAYKEENPDTTDRPTLIFPIQIMTQEGVTTAVSDQDALDAIKADCPTKKGKRSGRKG